MNLKRRCFLDCADYPPDKQIYSLFFFVVSDFVFFNKKNKKFKLRMSDEISFDRGGRVTNHIDTIFEEDIMWDETEFSSITRDAIFNFVEKKDV